MKGVAPKGSMLASSILLMMELPAIEAARPARKPTHTYKIYTHLSHKAGLKWLNDPVLVCFL